MKRLLAAALLLALPLAAQGTGAAYRLDTVAVRLDGQAGGINSGTSTPATCTTAGQVPIFLGSPLALGCDAGLTYEAATDTLTLVGGLRGSLKAGANVAANTITHIGSLGTGTGAAGTIIFQTGVPQAAGATQHVPATVLTLTNAGTGGTSAPQVLVPAGTYLKPGLAFDSNPSAGIYQAGPNVPVLIGTAVGIMNSNGGTAMRWAPLAGATYTTTVPSTAMIGFASNTNPVSPQDTSLTRAAAATLQLGAADAAAPIAQTLGVQGGSGTNIAGQPRVNRGSLGTGSADPGALIDRTGYPTTSGTTTHAESSRRYVSGHWTALTAGAATGFATLTYAASTSIGAEFFVTVRAGDASNRQGMSYRVAVNSVRDAAGNTQSVAAVIGTPPVAAGSGTLTCTFDVAEGAAAATLRANCASSLTETFLDANFQLIANGPGLTVGTL